MMNKERVIYISVLLLVLVAIGAVYQFYFRAKLEEYGADKKLLASLNETHGQLKGAFGSGDPDDVIRAWRGEVEAWRDAIDTRVPYFSDNLWRIHDQPPEGELILQFWYGDQTTKVINEFVRRVQEKYGAAAWQAVPQGFPHNIHSMFGVTSAQQWQGLNVTPELVNVQLERLSYGISAFELLMNNGAQRIAFVKVEEVGSSGFIGKDVDYVRIAYSFSMDMKTLVTFMDKLNSDESYYSVQGMRLTYPLILDRREPLMQVDMYLQRTKAKESLGVEAIATDAGTGYTTLLDDRPEQVDDDARREPEVGSIAKAWKWFMRTVFLVK